MTNPRLKLSRAQILAFRRRVGALDERLPRGRRSLRLAAWAGLQDSMPRAAVLSIHARVERTEPSTWEDPSLVQLWGPRYHAYVVAARDLAVFSLGRLPEEGKTRRTAEDLAARLHASLDGRRMPYGEAGQAIGVPGNALRYAALTGTVAIRWEGARQPTVWTVPPPEIDAREARLELARRHLHVFGPATPEAFAEWAGIGLANSRRSVRRAPADRGADADRRCVDPRRRRGDVPRPTGGRRARTAPPERRRLLPPPRSRSRAPGPRRRPTRRAVDLARMARRPPRRGRRRRDVAPGAGDDDGPDLATPLARGARCRRSGSGVPAAAGHRREDRRPLGPLSAVSAGASGRAPASGPGPSAHGARLRRPSS